MPKVLFFDIDGTLVDWRVGIREVPEGVVRELRRIQAMGHLTFISSGRPWSFVGSEYRELGFDGYVLNNGGHVQVGDVTIHEERMGTEAARKAVAILAQEGCEYALDTAHHVYIDRSFADMRHSFRTHADVITVDFDLEEVIPRVVKLESKPSVDVRARIADRVADECADLIRCGDNGTGMTFEMYSPRLSKAVGIARVFDYLGVSPDDAYAFGDGMNDLEMFAACGTSVAMGNAVPAVKEAADLVCGSVEERGLERILAELF